MLISTGPGLAIFNANAKWFCSHFCLRSDQTAIARTQHHPEAGLSHCVQLRNDKQKTIYTVHVYSQSLDAQPDRRTWISAINNQHGN